MLKKTVCARDCYDSCSMIFEINDKNQLINVSGNPNHPITQGFLCPRGHTEIKRIFTNRIKTPFLRKNNQFIPITWDKAIDIFAQKIQQTINTYGPQAILYLTYDGNSGLIHNLFVHRLWYKLNVTLTDMAICTTTGHKILELHYGSSHGIFPSELPKQKLIVFWGMNPTTTAPHIWHKALQAKKNNAKIITIDSIKTPTARHSDLHVQPFPGTDTALALFIIGQIIKNNKHNKSFLNTYTQNFSFLKQQALQWTLEKTANFTHIPQKTLLQLAKLYINNQPSATLIGVALQKKDFGWEHIRSISFIPTILGMHRHFFYSNGKAFFIDYDLISGKIYNPKPNLIPQVATSDFIYNNYFKLIVVSSMNPAQTITNTQKFISGIKKNNIFLVVIDSHWSETAKLANLVLPAPTFIEKQDLIISWSHCYTHFSNPVIPPLFQSKSEVQIMQSLAKKLQLSDPWLFENPVQVLIKATENAFENNQQLDLNGKIQKLKTKPADSYPTPSGKINFAPNYATKLNISPYPKQPPLPKLKQNQLILLSTAIPKNTNSQFREVFGNPKPYIYLNPATAQSLNLKPDQTVQIINQQDTLTFKIKITDSVPPNVAWTPRSISDLNSKPLNNIISSDFQIFGRGPKFHSTIITIKPLNPNL